MVNFHTHLHTSLERWGSNWKDHNYSRMLMWSIASLCPAWVPPLMTLNNKGTGKTTCVLPQQGLQYVGKKWTIKIKYQFKNNRTRKLASSGNKSHLIQKNLLTNDSARFPHSKRHGQNCICSKLILYGIFVETLVAKRAFFVLQ